ncbi:hypothetical protein TNCV_74631 [Trichonephila clavipes]|nr:hypothetical protein TNCV_74631 [Trichonephila clavipes]
MVAQQLTQITPPAATPNQLWQRVEAAWSSVPQEHIQSLFESMWRRVAAVISNNGATLATDSDKNHTSQNRSSANRTFLGVLIMPKRRRYPLRGRIPPLKPTTNQNTSSRHRLEGASLHLLALFSSLETLLRIVAKPLVNKINPIEYQI